MVERAMSAARDEILARVRGALANVPAGEQPEDVLVPRAYLEREPGATVDRFLERVADYGAQVRTVGPGELAEAVAEACRDQGVERLAVPEDLPAEWIPAGIEAVADAALASADLDRIGAALTGCALAIAETGTVIFDAGSRQGRRALTLVVDVHICVVEERQIVDGVPAAFRLLASGLRTTRRPLTLVSGPSATSDIEFARVEGVHGPRRLELIVVAG
jgi:L-lactate dehydrogenase complex protein LldG